MIRRPPRSTRTDTLLPYTTLFRSDDWRSLECNGAADPGRRNLHRSSRLRLQPLRTPGERHRARIAAIRAACRPDQDFTLDSSKRSEEHTSELQSLMRISYAVFFLKKKKT